MIDASIAVIDLTTRVASESMSNQSLRERFGLPDEKKNGDAGRGAAAWAGPGGTDQLICGYLRNHGNSRTAVISKPLGIPDRTVRDGMRRLVDRDIVETHGSNRNRTYSPKRQQASRRVTQAQCRERFPRQASAMMTKTLASKTKHKPAVRQNKHVSVMLLA